jgi:HTH-type transcriptional regulator / antitoxin HipB
MADSGKPIKTPAQLGIAIKQRRSELKLDQASLAKKAGISRAWLLEIEKGKPGVSIALLLRVLRSLQLSLFLGASDEMAKQAAPGSTHVPSVDLNSLLDSLRKNG